MSMIKHELAQMEMQFFASIHKEMAPGVSVHAFQQVTLKALLFLLALPPLLPLLRWRHIPSVVHAHAVTSQ
jgi:hypothetical protein